MAYRLLDSPDFVQVLGPSLVSIGMLCTIQSYPSGSYLIRFVPADAFDQGNGGPLCASLSDAVEQLLSAGVATAAEGEQGIDDNGLLFDAVRFTVTYLPPTPTPGTIQAAVVVPVDVITADPGLSAFLTGGSASDRIAATYQQLVAMAGV